MIEEYPELIGFDPTELFLDSRNKAIDALAIGWTSDWLTNFLDLIGGGILLSMDWVDDDIKCFINSLTGDSVNEDYVKKV